MLLNYCTGGLLEHDLGIIDMIVYCVVIGVEMLQLLLVMMSTIQLSYM